VGINSAKRYSKEVGLVTREGIDAAKRRVMDGETSLLSRNLTCGVAVNVSIHHTCKTDARSGEGASPLCAVACYAKEGNLGMRLAIVKQIAVYEIIRDEPVAWVAARLHADYARHARKLHGRFRFNASGDLFPQQVAVINELAEHPEKYPFIERIYLYSKRPSLVNLLAHRPDRLAVFVSLDASNQRIARLVRWPWAQVAWMVSGAGEHVPASVPAATPGGTMPVTVLFPEHAAKKTLPVTGRTCPKLIPADQGGIPMKDACVTCTRCSDDPRGLWLPAEREVA